MKSVIGKEIEEKKLQVSKKNSGKAKSKENRPETKNNAGGKTATNIVNEFYRIGKVLGKGAFGKVNLAIHRETGELVAIKSINKTYLADATSNSKVMQEVTILKKIKHTNIICLRDYFETDTHIIFVLEL